MTNPATRRERRNRQAEGKRPEHGGQILRVATRGLIICAYVCVAMGMVQAHAAADPIQQPGTYGYFDFPTCVRYALVHSEQLIESQVDIQIRSSELKDAHAELFPQIELTTRMYLARANENDNSYQNPVNVNIRMKNWNPYVSLFKIKGNRIMVDIAKLVHSYKIAGGLAKLAKLFYKVDVLKRQISARKRMLALKRNKISYAKSRKEQGEVDELTLRAWTNALRGERIAIKALDAELEATIGQLKALIGYHPDYYLPLDTRDAINQILSGFNGSYVTFSDIQAHNHDLGILARKEQLQSVKVSGAYVSILPRPVILFEDINNQVDRSTGLNFALGFDYTLWDGFRKVRAIKREKMKARQFEVEREVKARELYIKYRGLLAMVGVSGEKETVFFEQVKLAEMAEEKALTAYKAGELSYDQYMDARLNKVEADLSAIDAFTNRIEALIDLATLAGGLNKYNARIKF